MVTIIGGGPAGATCAYYLAKKGVYVTLYEARPNDRKPCAGGLRKKIFIDHTKLVRDLKKIPVRRVVLSFDSKQREMTFSSPIGYVVDRLALDKALRAAAKNAGCRVVNKFVDVNDLKDDIIVDARGAYPRAKNGLCITTICKIKNPKFRIDFVSKYNRLGYFWVFPMSESKASVGVGEFGRARFEKLNEGLNWYIGAQGGKVLWKRAWHESASIASDILSRRTDGSIVIKVGERAGFVNPATGEGIYYAMQSGKALANAIAGERLWSYAMYAKWTEFKFMILKMLRDIVLFPNYKPAIGLAGARLIGKLASCGEVV